MDNIVTIFVRWNIFSSNFSKLIKNKYIENSIADIATVSFSGVPIWLIICPLLKGWIKLKNKINEIEKYKNRLGKLKFLFNKFWNTSFNNNDNGIILSK